MGDGGLDWWGMAAWAGGGWRPGLVGDGGLDW